MHSWRLRHACIAGLASSAFVLRHWDFIHPDLLIAQSAARMLLSQASVHTYSVHPEAQMGPLALMLSLVPHAGYLLIVCLALVPTFWLLLPDVRPPVRGASFTVLMLTCSLSAGYAWSQLSWKGHADDAIVLLGAALVLWSLRRENRWGAAAGAGLALAGKPTGIALLPLLLGDPVAAVLALAFFALVWGPFFVGDFHGMLRAGRGIMPIGRSSVPDYLAGTPGAPIPAWVRPVQLLGSLAAPTLGHLRREPAAGLMLAFAIRALVETNPAPAYAIPLVVLAVRLDMATGRPTLTLLGVATMVASQRTLDGGSGGLRVVLLVAIALLCVRALVTTAPKALAEGSEKPRRRRGPRREPAP